MKNKKKFLSFFATPLGFLIAVLAFTFLSLHQYLLAANITAGTPLEPDSSAEDISLFDIASDGASGWVIAYADDGILKVIRCSDRACASKTGPTTIDTAAQATDVRVLIDSSNQVIIGYDHTGSGTKGIKVAVCDSLDCTGTVTGTTVVSTAGHVPFRHDMVLNSSGFPVFVYMDPISSGDLHLIECTNAVCSTRNTNVVDGAPAIFSQNHKLQLDSSGFPVVAYADSSSELAIAHCSDAACSSTPTKNTVNFGSGGFLPNNVFALELDSSGFPMVYYVVDSGGDAGELHLVRCNDVNCAGGNEANTIIDGTGLSNGSPGMDAFINSVTGFPVVVRPRNSVGTTLYECDSLNCTSPTITTLIATEQGEERIAFDGVDGVGGSR